MEFRSNAPLILPSHIPRNSRHFYRSPPAFAMQHSQEHRSLWYVVIGKPSPSLVHVPIRHKIDDLKNAICEGRHDLHAPNIILWKLNSSISVTRGNLTEIDVFTQSLAKIELPDPYSAEAHDAKGVVHLLDGSTKVSNHWPENYQQGHLHLIVQDQPVEGSELDTFLRFRTHFWGKNRVQFDGKTAFETIDLSLVNLPQLNLRSTKIILVRKEYRFAYDAILAAIFKKAGTHRSVFLITGHPGIGKTLCLLYFLLRRLQEREPVALQIDDSQFVLFDKYGVHKYKIRAIGTFSIPKGTWTLSDSSGELDLRPCTAFQRSEGHIIHTSPPASCRWSDWVKQLGATRYIMDIWSPEEFRALLTVSKLDIQHGLTLFHKYGSAVRVILDILGGVSDEETHVGDIQTAANKLALEDLITLDYSSNEVSWKLFMLEPNNLVVRRPALTIPSAFLCKTIGLALARSAAAQQHKVFTMLSSHPSLRSPAGWMFENVAHVIVADPKRSPLHTYDCNNRKLILPTPKEVISGTTALGRIQQPFDFYWRPREPNFEGVDAVIRFGDEVWALQFTVSSYHRAATNGLTEVHKTMNHKRNVDYRLVMVGSTQSEAEYARDSQKLTGQWAKTPVYACNLPLCIFDTQKLQQLQDSFDDAIGRYSNEPIDV